jgi:hypothetical protein
MNEIMITLKWSIFCLISSLSCLKIVLTCLYSVIQLKSKVVTMSVRIKVEIVNINNLEVVDKKAIILINPSSFRIGLLNR